MIGNNKFFRRFHTDLDHFTTESIRLVALASYDGLVLCLEYHNNVEICSPVPNSVKKSPSLDHERYTFQRNVKLIKLNVACWSVLYVAKVAPKTPNHICTFNSR